MANEQRLIHVLRDLARVGEDDGAGAPGYHYDMMNDQPRNDAYCAALKQVVEKDAFVLDIGTGSGLLSLMAAKHTPAQHIFACEADATLAAAARAVVEANDCREHVTVVGPRFSHELRVGLSGKADLPCRADVIVMEIFDSSLLGENVLPTMHDAATRLLAADGCVIPARGTLMGVLVEAPTYAQRVWSPTSPQVQGGFAPMQCHAGQALQAKTLRVLSPVVPLLSFDFAAPVLKGARVVEVPVLHSGTPHGILFWWTLDMAPGISLDTAPDLSGAGCPSSSVPARDHWRQCLCVFSQAPVRRVLAAGDTVWVAALHNADTPWFALAQDGVGEADVPSLVAHFPLLTPVAHSAALAHYNAADATVSSLTFVLRQLCATHCSRSVVLVGDGPALSVAAADFDVRRVVFTKPLLVDTFDTPCTIAQPEVAPAAAHALPLFAADTIARHLGFGNCLSVIMAEPFFYDLRAPGAKSWLLDEFIRLWALTANLSPVQRAAISPARCSVTCQAIKCPRLWQTRQPVATVHGVSLDVFNHVAARPPGPAFMSLEPWAGDITLVGNSAVCASLDIATPFAGTYTVTLPLDSVVHAIVLSCQCVAHDGTVTAESLIGNTDSEQRLAVLFLPPMEEGLTSAFCTVKLQMTAAGEHSQNATAGVWDALRGGVCVSYSAQFQNCF